MHLVFLFLLIIPLVISEDDIQPTFRLPSTIDPLLYSIKLHPNIDEGSFTGEVLIRVRAKNTVRSLLLHSRELSINEVRLNQQKLRYTLHPEYDLLEIARKNQSSIPPGVHNVFVKFEGSLLNRTSGLYRATFTEEDGKASYLVVSDFQPSDARKAFPCFDEPAFKAKFQVTLIAPNRTYVALSNMNEITSYETPHGIAHRFETTCLMSTYLLAFSISQYTYVESLKGNVATRVYSANASEANNCTALVLIPKFLEFYREYTRFEYPLPKIDFIEYDRNGSAATENWGLVTTARGIISPDDRIYSDWQVAWILAHEVSHFWFGNLVTNDWWSDIWLQEGFAEFMTVKALNYANSSVELRDVLESQWVYWQDQQGKTNAVVAFVETRQEIRQHFNDITYIKGAAVLTMLETFLGEHDFQKVVRIYILSYAYKTASTHDFISIVESVSRTSGDVRGFLESFLYQKHFPIVEVSENAEAYVLRQVSSNTNDTQSKWTIPITFTSDSVADKQTVWFDRNMDQLYVPKSKGEKWIKFNYKNDGYYRINYSKTMWDKFYMHCMEMENLDLELLISEALTLFNLNIVPCQVLLTDVNQIVDKKDSLDVPAFLYFKEGILELTRAEGNLTMQLPAREESCLEWAKENFQSILNFNSSVY